MNNELLNNILANANGTAPGQEIQANNHLQLIQQLAAQQQSQQNQQNQQRINIQNMQRNTQIQRGMIALGGQPLTGQVLPGQHLVQNPGMIQFLQKQQQVISL